MQFDRSAADNFWKHWDNGRNKNEQFQVCSIIELPTYKSASFNYLCKNTETHYQWKHNIESSSNIMARIFCCRIVKMGLHVWIGSSFEILLVFTYTIIYVYFTLFLYCPIFSVIGLYVSFILLIGRVLRISTTGQSTTISFRELPRVDNILRLCLDIYLVREMQEYRLEEDLYAKLIFVYRSAETRVKWTRLRMSQILEAKKNL